MKAGIGKRNIDDESITDDSTPDEIYADELQIIPDEINPDRSNTDDPNPDNQEEVKMQLLRGSNSRIIQLIFHINNQEIQVHEIIIQQILMTRSENVSGEVFKPRGSVRQFK